jgi:broad specificity phosphatase PhoE
MLAAFTAINDRHQDQTILIVSHADPLWMLESGLLGLSPAAAQRRWLTRSYGRGELRHIYQTAHGWRFVKL